MSRQPGDSRGKLYAMSVRAILFPIAVSFTLVGCKGLGSSIVGTWKPASGHGMTVVLKSDGTGSVTPDGGRTIEGTYTTTDKSIILSIKDPNPDTISFEYVLSGNELTLTRTHENPPRTVKYVRQ